MKTKVLLLCAAAAACLPAISYAQPAGEIAVRVAEEVGGNVARKGGAAGIDMLINTEKGLGAAGNALNAAVGT